MILKPNTGIDISDYQPGLQIGTLNPLPRFVIIKATEGVLFKAKLTTDFAAQCRALGIPYGFYHFWNNFDPYKQASNYIAQVNAAGGFERIPPVLDIEIGGLVDANIKTWLDVVEDVAGKRPILYSNKYHFDMLADNAWFKNYDVWTAAYPDDPDLWSWCPILYSEKRARREIMWQYGSKYRYSNYSANSIDTNIAITDFLNEIGAIVTPPTGETMKYTATAISDGTRLRPESNVNKTYLSSHARGTKFDGDVLFTATAPTVPNQSVGDKWLQVKAINGVPFTGVGWVAITHLGAPVCTLVENVVTPPPAPTGDIQFSATLKADGTITGTWKEI